MSPDLNCKLEVKKKVINYLKFMIQSCYKISICTSQHSLTLCFIVVFICWYIIVRYSVLGLGLGTESLHSGSGSGGSGSSAGRKSDIMRQLGAGSEAADMKHAHSDVSPTVL